MYVTRMFCEEECIDFPTWEKVEEIIDLLDGEAVTQITMDNGNEDDYLCIGGGNDGLCNVYVSRNDNELIYTLINPSADPATVRKLVTGGQEGDFEDRLCVPVALAKRAAKTYCECGQTDASLVWE